MLEIEIEIEKEKGGHMPKARVILHIQITQESLPGSLQQKMFKRIRESVNESAFISRDQCVAVMRMVDEACRRKKADAVLQIPAIASFINTCHE